VHPRRHENLLDVIVQDRGQAFALALFGQGKFSS
jgi:hypothetical protein